jgi:hypothetical protein
MRYRWEIRTGDTWYAGTDASVYLSIVGDKGSMKEMELNDPDNNDWEKGDVNHGVFETADLGMLTTGTLRQDGSGTQSDWTVDYVKITNDEDGRVWTTGVNAELKGNQPHRLVFKLTIVVSTMRCSVVPRKPIPSGKPRMRTPLPRLKRKPQTVKQPRKSERVAKS